MADKRRWRSLDGKSDIFQKAGALGRMEEEGHSQSHVRLRIVTNEEWAAETLPESRESSDILYPQSSSMPLTDIFGHLAPPSR